MIDFIFYQNNRQRYTVIPITTVRGPLSDPANGNVTTLPGTTFESLAEYRCNEGYKLSYPAGRTRLSSGLWSGIAPRREPEPVCWKLGK